MFTPEQKKFVYENSVKVTDNKKYIEIMALYSECFEKAKRISIKRKIGLIFILLIAVYIACKTFLFQTLDTSILVFRGAAIFVVALLVLKFGMGLLNYIDDMPVINKIKNKECDLLYYVGDLNDVSKSINYGTSSNLQNYFMTVSGVKYQIDRKNYKILSEHKGKKIYIYYFPELLTRQMYITDASIILIEQ